ncbi:MULTISPECIES: Uma2 family endonuclease [unclassified Leptolyngbya]|uniref:Uma2 family endonuclease n=1 Tax=unclassified Leptolyngbya TaxID=2650499 RepID=UPI0016839AFA|nr:MULTISPECIES: Uma2 family endonuclease [unclassified Leptolyngbya]MBD1913479.1 Uma2 family endonuclease [Leptolyngbya sp. FACHB-8]MBD2154895.1 Uma2 family endonuclease [Leptolyngbya sp. FACHB-16]
MTALTLKLDSIVRLTDEQFYQLCQDNPELKLERTATGALVIMSPTGGETGKRNSDLNLELGLWNRRTWLGVVFDSSTGFKLPNGADRSPDAAWISQERWDRLTPEQRKRFLPLCPDFLIELLSPTDTWEAGEAKMREYQENGNALGWLIDPATRRVAIYRLGQPMEILESPASLSGEDVLPEFVLDLQRIW